MVNPVAYIDIEVMRPHTKSHLVVRYQTKNMKEALAKVAEEFPGWIFRPCWYIVYKNGGNPSDPT